MCDVVAALIYNDSHCVEAPLVGCALVGIAYNARRLIANNESRSDAHKERCCAMRHNAIPNQCWRTILIVCQSLGRRLAQLDAD